MAGKYDHLAPDTNWRNVFRLDDVKPSPPDARDFPALARTETPVTLPASFRLPQRTIKNQGGKGSCVAFSVARIMEHGFAIGGRNFDASEEEMYARLRAPHGWLCQDTGSYPRDCADISVKEGWLTEAERPYNDRDLCTGPHPNRIQLAAGNRGREYRKARNWEDVKQLLYQFKTPVTICLTVYDSFFNTGRDGIMPSPTGKPAGGHCMVFEGWDEQYAWVANSWSSGFGLNGYLRVPLRYVDGTVPDSQGGVWSDDMWAVIVQEPQPEPQPEPEPDMGYVEGYNAAKQQVLALMQESVDWYTTADPSDFARAICEWHRDVIQGFQPPAAAVGVRPRPKAPRPPAYSVSIGGSTIPDAQISDVSVSKITGTISPGNLPQ